MSERFTHREVGGDAAPLNGGTPKGKRRGQPAPVALWASAARGRALGRWATACCAAVVLAGCSGESAPTASSGDVAPSDMSRIASGNASSSKTTSAPSSTSSNTNGQSREFVVPDAAKAHTQKGAENYLRHYYDSMHLAYTTPKAGELKKLGTPDCLACSKMDADVAALAQKQHRLRYASTTVTELKIEPESLADQVLMTFVVTDSAGDEVDSGGNSVARVEQQSSRHTALVVWQGSGWKIKDIGQSKP